MEEEVKDTEKPERVLEQIRSYKLKSKDRRMVISFFKHISTGDWVIHLAFKRLISRKERHIFETEDTFTLKTFFLMHAVMAEFIFTPENTIPGLMESLDTELKDFKGMGTTLDYLTRIGTHWELKVNKFNDTDSQTWTHKGQ